jgi:2Fe-2S ferredoxin
MPQITFIEHNGTTHTVDVSAGTSLMQAAVDHGIDAISAECGGACSCATCHCYIDAPWQALTGAANATEESMLEHVLDPRPGSRLSCQVQITDAMDGLQVSLPASQY